jgi:1-acyl-sn-glycerol-3-phosphate acyltransferase
MISWLTALNVVSFSLLAIAILCRLSPTFKFYFKTLALYMNMIFTSIFTIPYGLVYYGQHGRICVFAASVCLWFGEMMGVRYRIEVEGDVVDKKKGFIVVCNHQSALDVTAMSKVCSHILPVVVLYFCTI